LIDLRDIKMDKIDPICGMKGTIPAHGHFFCSEYCINKYEKENNIKTEDKYCPSCSTKNIIPWYKERLYIVFIFTVILLILGFLIPFLNPFFEAFIDYLQLIWLAIIIGFFIGGIIDYFIPREYIKKYLSRRNKRTIFYSIVFGFLMSACSHGILAISIELYKKGASTSSVIAFLLASPWANLPITILLFSFFGTKALLIIISALIIAVITGLIYQVLERKELVECNSCNQDDDVSVLMDFSIIKDIKKRWSSYNFNFKNNIIALKGTLNGAWALTKMVMWWLIIGMVMASFARAYIPNYIFIEYMRPTVLGLLITLFFATIIEVCSEGSSPLAFEIFNQTGAFGNSFTFLMAGVATDYTEIGLIWHNIGRKTALWLPIITVPQILFLGFIFNFFT
jgi:uncharacterized membrane protein YraQ (UPF0718 family)